MAAQSAAARSDNGPTDAACRGASSTVSESRGIAGSASSGSAAMPRNSSRASWPAMTPGSSRKNTSVISTTAMNTRANARSGSAVRAIAAVATAAAMPSPRPASTRPATSDHTAGCAALSRSPATIMAMASAAPRRGLKDASQGESEIAATANAPSCAAITMPAAPSPMP